MKKLKLPIFIALTLLMLTTCQQPAGIGTDVNSKDMTGVPVPIPYPIFSDSGVVRYITLEGGFWGIVGVNGNYEPINLPREYQIDGLGVQFTAYLRTDLASIHMWGKLIQIISISKIPIPVPAVKAYFGQEFKLPVTRTALITDPVSITPANSKDNVLLTFSKVLSDSRCPTGAMCIWQGEATILVRVFINSIYKGDYKMSTLNTGNVLIIDNIVINFTNLYPYPSIDTPIDPVKYVASFIVKKK